MATNINEYGNDEQNEQEVRKEEEKAFLRLFTHVLDKIIERKSVEDGDIYQSISALVDSWKTKKTDHDIDFTQWSNICGYVFRFGPHGADFARFRILNALNDCRELKDALIKKSDLKIISLGSGPGNDVIGFCSALSELKYPENLHITLVDKFKAWSLCIDIIKEALTTQESNFGKVSELFKNSHVELSFIEVNLPGDLESDKEYFEKLRKADIVVMSKYFSSLKARNTSELYFVLILHQHTNEDAIILVNDKISMDRYPWSKFQRVYCSSGDYSSIRNPEKRFNQCECTSSKLPINVLVKKK